MQRLLTISLFLLVAFTWGTTWMAMKITVDTIPPLFATGLRFLSAAPLLLSMAWLTKTPILFPHGQRGFQAIICIFYFALPFSLMIYGETYVSSGLASLIFATMPVAVLGASVLFLQTRPRVLQLAGLTLALLALSSILLEESAASGNSEWRGILALVFAVLMHASMYAQCKKRGCQVSVLTFNALPSLVAGLLLLLLGGLTESPNLAGFSHLSLLATLYLGMFAGVCGILSYFALQQRASAFHASTVFLIFPFIALSLESYVEGSTLSMRSMLLLIPLILGISLTLVPAPVRKKEQDRATSVVPQ
jgi:putative membrane protein PagO